MALRDAASDRGLDVSLLGIDIDPRMLNGAWNLTEHGISRDGLICDDFFSVSPTSTGWGPVDGIIGNPPYVRHHTIAGSTKELAMNSLRGPGVELSGLADLWAYFVVHATSFLTPGGHLAFLLPYAALGARYAQPVMNYLSDRFGSVQVIRLKERVFPGIREGTTVLTCLGWQEGPSQIARMDVDRLSDLRDALPCRSHEGDEGSTLPGSKWLPGEAGEILQDLREHEHVSQLDEFCDTRIGIVTGANDFFILPPTADVARATDTLPVLTRSRQLAERLRWTDSDLAALTDSEARCLLIRPERPFAPVLEDYLESAEATAIRDRSHCANRDPWYRVLHTKSPDAFFRYMGATPGWLVENRTEASATNAIHRIYWTTDDPRQRAALIVGSLTTLFTLSQETFGRAYGGGLLKLELGGLRRCLIPNVSVGDSLLERLHGLIQTGDTAQARDEADAAVLAEGLDLGTRQIQTLRDLATRMAHRRSVVRPAVDPKREG